MMRSGYSSRILEMSKVPIPDPVPPPKEWASWKPYNIPCWIKLSIKYSHFIGILPEDSHSSQLLFGLHPTPSQPIQHLQCSDPLPSCCQLRSDRKQSYQVWRSFHMAQNELSPWYQAPSQPRQHVEHTCHLEISHLYFSSKERFSIKRLTWCLIVVYVDSFKLETAVADILSLRIYAMFIGNDFPELEIKLN